MLANAITQRKEIEVIHFGKEEVILPLFICIWHGGNIQFKGNQLKTYYN